MTTKFIGIKEFRQNLAAYTKESSAKQVRFIILKKNIPVLEVKSLNEKSMAREKIADEITKARTDVKKGKVYTQKEIMKEFGLL